MLTFCFWVLLYNSDHAQPHLPHFSEQEQPREGCVLRPIGRTEVSLVPALSVSGQEGGGSFKGIQEQSQLHLSKCLMSHLARELSWVLIRLNLSIGLWRRLLIIIIIIIIISCRNIKLHFHRQVLSLCSWLFAFGALLWAVCPSSFGYL